MSDETKKGDDLGAFPIKIKAEKEVKEAENNQPKINEENSFNMTGHAFDQMLPAGKDSPRRNIDYVAKVEKATPDLVKNGEITGLRDLTKPETYVVLTIAQIIFNIVKQKGMLGKNINIEAFKFDIDLSEFTEMFYKKGYGKTDMIKALEAIESLAYRIVTILYEYVIKGQRIINHKLTDSFENVKEKSIHQLFAFDSKEIDNPDGTTRTHLWFSNIHPVLFNQLNDKWITLPRSINYQLRNSLPKPRSSLPIHNFIWRHITAKNLPKLPCLEKTWLKTAGLTEEAKTQKKRAIKYLTDTFEALIKKGMIVSYEQQAGVGGILWVVECNMQFKYT